MPKRNTDTPLSASILSLLVAADQCCPVIIGQAHLLYYHAGPGINPEQAANTFTRLKKDAGDLFKAIADVEAALNRGQRRMQRGAERDDTESTNEPDGVRSLPARSSGPCSRART